MSLIAFTDYELNTSTLATSRYPIWYVSAGSQASSVSVLGNEMMLSEERGCFNSSPGRKAPYYIASAIFTTGIVLSSFTLNWEMFIIARALCGLGSANFTTMGMKTLLITVLRN